MNTLNLLVPNLSTVQRWMLFGPRAIRDMGTYPVIGAVVVAISPHGT